MSKVYKYIELNKTLEADTKLELITMMRNTCIHDKYSLYSYMKYFAKRTKKIYNIDITTNNPEHFIDDLISHGIVEVVELN